MANIFERATRQKLRINCIQGTLNVSQLWDLDLGPLNTIAVSLSKEVKATSEESFISEAATSNPTLNLRFDIVKHIITVKLAEAKTARTRSDKKAKRDQLLRLIADKQNDELANKSIEELTKELDAVED